MTAADQNKTIDGANDFSGLSIDITAEDLIEVIESLPEDRFRVINGIEPCGTEFNLLEQWETAHQTLTNVRVHGDLVDNADDAIDGSIDEDSFNANKRARRHTLLRPESSTSLSLLQDDDLLDDQFVGCRYQQGSTSFPSPVSHYLPMLTVSEAVLQSAESPGSCIARAYFGYPLYTTVLFSLLTRSMSDDTWTVLMVAEPDSYEHHNVTPRTTSFDLRANEPAGRARYVSRITAHGTLETIDSICHTIFGPNCTSVQRRLMQLFESSLIRRCQLGADSQRARRANLRLTP